MFRTDKDVKDIVTKIVMEALVAAANLDSVKAGRGDSNEVTSFLKSTVEESARKTGLSLMLMGPLTMVMPEFISARFSFLTISNSGASISFEIEKTAYID